MHVVMTQLQLKEENNNRFKQITDFMFIQMFASKGLNCFGERAVAALF